MKEKTPYYGSLTRLWWIPMVTGVLSVAFGIWCFCSPEASLTVFAYLFAACMVVAALLNFVYAFLNTGKDSGWGWALALGILELLAGVWLFSLPQIVLVDTFIFVIGIWIIVAAINSICEACVLSSVSPGWMVWMILLLFVTIVFAVLFLSNPVVGGVAVWLYIGISLITFGVFRIVFAVKAKQLNNEFDGLI
ncbi:MAG: DUF308 domain-containing protein [Muribaculaceae bacterium]